MASAKQLTKIVTDHFSKVARVDKKYITEMIPRFNPALKGEKIKFSPSDDFAFATLFLQVVAFSEGLCDEDDVMTIDVIVGDGKGMDATLTDEGTGVGMFNIFFPKDFEPEFKDDLSKMAKYYGFKILE